MTELQIKILKRLAQRISFTTNYYAQVIDDVLWVQGHKIFFNGDYLINPHTLPTDIRIIINEVNGL